MVVRADERCEENWLNERALLCVMVEPGRKDHEGLSSSATITLCRCTVDRMSIMKAAYLRESLGAEVVYDREDTRHIFSNFKMV